MASPQPPTESLFYQANHSNLPIDARRVKPELTDDGHVSDHFRHESRSPVYMQNYYATTYKRDFSNDPTMNEMRAKSGNYSAKPIYQGHLAVYNASSNHY